MKKTNNNLDISGPRHHISTSDNVKKAKEILKNLNSVEQNKLMTEEDWKKFGEIQYLKGRLDELFKLDRVLGHLDMNSLRVLDARTVKYLDKLRRVDPMAYHLYHIERENIKYTIERINQNKDPYEK